MGDSSVGRAEIRRWCHLYGRWPDNHSRRRLYHIKIYKEKTGTLLWSFWTLNPRSFLAKLLLCKWINCKATYFVIVNCSFAGTSILGIFQSKSCATCLAACNVECLPVNVWFDSLAGIYEYGLAREKRGPFGPGVAARTRLIDHFYLVQAWSGRSLASLG